MTKYTITCPITGPIAYMSNKREALAIAKGCASRGNIEIDVSYELDDRTIIIRTRPDGSTRQLVDAPSGPEFARTWETESDALASHVVEAVQ